MRRYLPGANRNSGARFAPRRTWLPLYLQERRRKRAQAAIPATPGNFQATDTGNSILLTWQDLSGNETGFRFYRNEAGNGYVLAQTLPANSSQYEDTEVEYTVEYRYYVTAFNADGESAPSAEAVLTFGA